MASSVLLKRYEFVPFPTGDRWDRVMTKQEFDRLNGYEKKTRSHVALIRKVALAQTAAENPAALPAAVVIPKDRKRLRDWFDSSLGLWTWVDVKLDYEHGVNAHVMEAFFKAVSDIAELKTGNQSKLRRQLAEKTLVIERLEFRTAQLLQKISRLQKIIADAGLTDADL